MSAETTFLPPCGMPYARYGNSTSNNRGFIGPPLGPSGRIPPVPSVGDRFGDKRQVRLSLARYASIKLWTVRLTQRTSTPAPDGCSASAAFEESVGNPRFHRPGALEAVTAR